MNLSDLQTKEVIDVATGRRIGIIIDAVLDRRGAISKLVLEDRKSSKRLFGKSIDDIDLSWNQIVKIGDDIILVDLDHNHVT